MSVCKNQPNFFLLDFLSLGLTKHEGNFDGFENDFSLPRTTLVTTPTFPFHALYYTINAYMLWERVVLYQIGFCGKFLMHMLLLTYRSPRSCQVSSKSTFIHASQIDCFYMVHSIVVVVNYSHKENIFWSVKSLVVFHEWTLILNLLAEHIILVL